MYLYDRVVDTACSVLLVLFGGWLGRNYVRTPADAVKDHLAIKAADDFRKILLTLLDECEPYTKRIILDSGAEFLIEKIVKVGDATVHLKCCRVPVALIEPRFDAVYCQIRLSSISYLDGEDHAESNQKSSP